MSEVSLYDTTLRDGSQMEGVNFSVQDKLQIAQKMDDFGIRYIEGGWPGSNPKDETFFEEASRMSWKGAKISAFGSTRRADNPVEVDKNISLLLRAETTVIALFGKSWDLHVREALRTTLEENLRMIGESVEYFKTRDKEVVYDAEHFFDGYRANADYALKTLEAAWNGGADILVLCDTNGGTLPHQLTEIFSHVARVFGGRCPLGIHAHNDSGVAVANSLEAVRLGAVQVQGTFNGYGERCGNADLCTVIPSLQMKMDVPVVSEENLRRLSELSHFISELANLRPDDYHPYVGKSAFTHKGGIHASAIMRHPATYEHVTPERVGNQRRILVSELAGRSNVVFRAKEVGVELDPKDPRLTTLIKTIKEAENEGYQYEGADASFELLLSHTLGETMNLFDFVGFRVIVEKREDGQVITEATIKLRVGEETIHTAAEGDGPVNALDNALRKALASAYPTIESIRLVDYKVRVLNERDGTAARIRVLIQTSDGQKVWGTVGVSTNIIEASWEALEESIQFGLWERKRH